jgi:hypothetical protein
MFWQIKLAAAEALRVELGELAVEVLDGRLFLEELGATGQTWTYRLSDKDGPVVTVTLQYLRQD